TDAVQFARLALRTASRTWAWEDAKRPGVGEEEERRRARPAITPGFLWGPKLCTCAGSPSLDAWHVLTECPRLEEARRTSIATATKAAAQTEGLQRYASVFGDVGRMLHTRAGRTFVYLAALGAALQPTSTVHRSGLPAEWVACLTAPRWHGMTDANGGSGSSGWHGGRSFAVDITFASFAPLVW